MAGGQGPGGGRRGGQRDTKHEVTQTSRPCCGQKGEGPLGALRDSEG